MFWPPDETKIRRFWLCKTQTDGLAQSHFCKFRSLDDGCIHSAWRDSPAKYTPNEISQKLKKFQKFLFEKGNFSRSKKKWEWHRCAAASHKIEAIQQEKKKPVTWPSAPITGRRKWTPSTRLNGFTCSRSTQPTSLHSFPLERKKNGSVEKHGKRKWLSVLLR